MDREFQTQALYCAIGRFAVAFEHMCKELHNAMLFMLSKEGMRNQQVSRVILAGMTAEPLRSLYQALIAEIHHPKGVEKIVVDSILRRTQIMISKRNDVIHSIWYIGYGSSPDDDALLASGYKGKRDGKGTHVKITEHRVEDFDALTRAAEELASLIHALSACHLFDHSIEKTFMIDGDKVVGTSVAHLKL